MFILMIQHLWQRRRKSSQVHPKMMNTLFDVDLPNRIIRMEGHIASLLVRIDRFKFVVIT